MRKGAAALRADGFDGDGQGADLVPVVPAGARRASTTTPAPTPTTSSSRSRRAFSARTGCRTTSRRANAGGIERVLV